MPNGSIQSGYGGSQSGVSSRDLGHSAAPGIFGKLSSLFWQQKAHEGPGIDSEAGSVILPKAHSSPFAAADTTSNGSGVKAAKSWGGPGGVVLPGAIASPFADMTSSTANMSLNTPPSRVLSPATSGASLQGWHLPESQQDHGVARLSTDGLSIVLTWTSPARSWCLYSRTVLGTQVHHGIGRRGRRTRERVLGSRIGSTRPGPLAPEGLA